MPSLAAYSAPQRPIADQLRQVALFADLPNDRRDCLALLRQGTVYDVPAGVEIVSPGEPAALMVITQGGLCDSSSALTWPAGTCLGAREFLAGQPFHGAISTIAPTLFYRLEAAKLQGFLQHCPAIAQCLVLEVAKLGASSATHEADWQDGGANI